MKRKILATMAALLLFGGIAAPAAAGTRTGTITCTAGATIAVRGEQQRIAVMTLKVSSITVYQSAARYVHIQNTPYSGTRTWSADSDWLTYNGSYAFCHPPVS